MTDDCAKMRDGARICPEGARYVKKVIAGPPRVAVLGCEGGCLKGEIARVAANILAYQLERDSSVRICMGDAVTGDSGFVKLVEDAPKTIVIEGCFMHCGTQIMKTRLRDFDPEIVESSRFIDFDRDKHFEIFDLPRAEIERYAKRVAEYVQQTKFQGRSVDGPPAGQDCCRELITVADLAEKYPALRQILQRDGRGEKGAIIRVLGECGYCLTEVADIIRAQAEAANNLDEYVSCPVRKIAQCL